MLREAGLIHTLVDLDWRVNETGDIKFDPPNSSDPQPDPAVMHGKAKNCYCVGKGLQKISDKANDLVVATCFVCAAAGASSVGRADARPPPRGTMRATMRARRRRL